MLNKKQIWVIFLFEFKMGHKTEETTCNISNAFDSATANECTVKWWFNKFCKGDKSFENEEYSGQPSEVDNNQLRPIIDADPLKTTWRTRCPPFYSHWAFETNWKDEKTSISGCIICWLQIKKAIILKDHLLFYAMVNNFLIGLWRVTKNGLCVMTSWTKKKLQSTS